MQRPPSLGAWTSGGNVWRPVVCASIPTFQTSGPTRTGLEAAPLLVGFVSVKSALQERSRLAHALNGNTAAAPRGSQPFGFIVCDRKRLQVLFFFGFVVDEDHHL